MEVSNEPPSLTQYSIDNISARMQTCNLNAYPTDLVSGQTVEQGISLQKTHQNLLVEIWDPVADVADGVTTGHADYLASLFPSSFSLPDVAGAIDNRTEPVLMQRSRTPSSGGSSTPPMAMYSKRPVTVLELNSQLLHAAAGFPCQAADFSCRESLIPFSRSSIETEGSLFDVSSVHENMQPPVSSTPFIQRSTGSGSVKIQSDNNQTISGHAYSGLIDPHDDMPADPELQILYGSYEMTDIKTNSRKLLVLPNMSATSESLNNVVVGLRQEIIETVSTKVEGRSLPVSSSLSSISSEAVSQGIAGSATYSQALMGLDQLNFKTESKSVSVLQSFPSDENEESSRFSMNDVQTRLDVSEKASLSLSARSNNSFKNSINSDEDLGEDVKRILAKYRNSFSSRSSSCPPTNTFLSVAEPGQDEGDLISISSGDTLSKRVQGLLFKDLHSSLTPVEHNSQPDIGIAQSISSLPENGHQSSGGSSRAMSVDYGSLWRDMDDIQASLDSMRTIEKASLNSSFSSVSKYLRQNMQSANAVLHNSDNVGLHIGSVLMTENIKRVEANIPKNGHVNLLNSCSIESDINIIGTTDTDNIPIARFSSQLHNLRRPVDVSCNSKDNFAVVQSSLMEKDFVIHMIDRLPPRVNARMISEGSSHQSDLSDSVATSIWSQALVPTTVSNMKQISLDQTNLSLALNENVSSHTVTNTTGDLMHSLSSDDRLCTLHQTGSKLSNKYTASIASSSSDRMASDDQRALDDVSTVEDVLCDSSRNSTPLSLQRGDLISASIGSTQAVNHGTESSKFEFSRQVQDVLEQNSSPRQSHEYLFQAEELAVIKERFASVAGGESKFCVEDTFHPRGGNSMIPDSVESSTLSKISSFDVMKSNRPVFESQSVSFSLANLTNSVEQLSISMKVTQQSDQDCSSDLSNARSLDLTRGNTNRRIYSEDSVAQFRSVSKSQHAANDSYGLNDPPVIVNSGFSGLSMGESEADKLVESSGEIWRKTNSEAFEDDQLVKSLMHKQVSPAGFMPYLPDGCPEVIYFESSVEDMSETTTVESTHPGSDDAKAPNFPPHVYGSRAEAPPGAVGIYHKKKSSPEQRDLYTVELSTTLPTIVKDGPTSCSQGHSGSSKSESSEKARRHEKELSLVKARAWLNDVSESTSSDKVPQSQNSNLVNDSGIRDSRRIDLQELQPIKPVHNTIDFLPREVRNLSFNDDSYEIGMVDKSARRTISNKDDSHAFCTPVKSVQSISASKISAQTAHPGVTRTAECIKQDSKYRSGDRYSVHLDSHCEISPGVETLVETYAAQPELQSTSIVCDDRQDLSTVIRKEFSRSDQPKVWAASNLSNDDLVAGEHSSSTPYDKKSATMGSVSFATALEETQLRQLWERFIRSQEISPVIMTGNTTDHGVTACQKESEVQEPGGRHLTIGSSNVKETSNGEFRAGADSNSLHFKRGSSVSPTAVQHMTNNGVFSVSWQTLSAEYNNQRQQESYSGSQLSRPMKQKPDCNQEKRKLEWSSGIADKVCSKQAWIVKDESLPPVPEDMTLESVTSDFTSTSSVDDFGKVVTHTTKRHLPGDPRLLRLQQKIHQQREKHRKAQANERRRKERIAELELRWRRENEKVTDKSRGRRQPVEMAKVTPVSSSSDVTASTATVVSSSFTTDDHADQTLCATANETDLDKSIESIGGETMQCACHRHPEIKHKASSVLMQRKTCSAKCAVHSPMLHLREVNHFKGKTEDSLPSQRRATTVGTEKFNKSPRTSKAHDRHGTNERWVGAQHIPTTLIVNSPKDDLKVTNSKLIDGGKKRYISAEHLDKMVNGGVRTAKKHVASKAVQTTPRLRNQNFYGVKVAGAQMAKSRDRFSSSAYEPDILVSKQAVDARNQHKVVRQPTLSWFIPLTGDISFKSPLKELQKHVEEIHEDLSSWYPRRWQNATHLPYDDDRDVVDKENRVLRSQLDKCGNQSWPKCQPVTTAPTSLQEAFDATMGEFVLRSQERKRFLLLRALRRRMQELEADKHRKLFGLESRHTRKTLADPTAEQLHRPQKRSFGKQEMKDLTRSQLPEASIANDKKNKLEAIRYNCMRRKRYSQRVLNRLLNKSR